ncbi:hypothetical protein BGZ95_003521 [Linnemannia exigua]|uniref:sn-1-specific diacylglycerol lipase n=1 Tax=Linnemannia exigua TaxID=604196 RepID=A0AAD4H1C4_9FUNG|nr:hypothetical protein BGZ95_003521 [Linnemannia exigua]
MASTSSTSNLYPALNPDADQQQQLHPQNHTGVRSTFGVDYSDRPVAPYNATSATTTSTTTTTTAAFNKDADSKTITRSHTTPVTTVATSKPHHHQHQQQQKKQQEQGGMLTLSPNEPIPLSTYISVSQIAISSALKVAMVSTSLSLGVARTIVSTLDKVLGFAVKGVVGQNDEGSSQGLNPAFVASLPFRAALLGINFSDILVQTILETVDGSVNLALNTVQDGLELMDSLFGPDSTSQTGETFREVWRLLSREFTQDAAAAGAPYPALEGIRLLMAYVAIQFATSEQWETIRVRTQGRLVGECFESKDEQLGSSTAWAAVGAQGWPEEWRGSLSEEELLQEVRIMELREQREGRSAASFSAYAGVGSGVRGFGSRGPQRPAAANPELTNFLAASYRFSRFCSAMYGSMALELMGAPESPRYYLLDDVETKQIVLVLRGTKSLHDLMIDLTCDAADLWLDHDTSPLRDAQGNILPKTEENLKRKRPFRVHGGFLKAARTIASAETIGIQEKVKAALEARPGYSLLLIGHSLGAGIASVLSMLWADPATGLTPEVPHHTCASRTTGATATSTAGSAPVSPVATPAPSSPKVGQGEWWHAPRQPTPEQQEAGQFYLPGYLPQNNVDSFLPPGRRVKCYGYGTPKVMCPRMSKRALKLVTSISYGDDVVGRLSLGSVRNIGHAMRALLAMRPPPPPSPPSSPPSSPRLNPTTTSTDIDLLHDSSETLDDLLEQEGENFSLDAELRAESEREAATAAQNKKAHKKPAPPSIGLEIVQKVIRWRLTGEESLLEEFMDIRRAMHKEMQKHQDHECHRHGDLFPLDEEHIGAGDCADYDQAYHHAQRTLDLTKISPVLVPAGKVLWIRPTTLEKELENEETSQHPLESVLHQFEWDHPLDRHDAASLLIPKPVSSRLQQSLEDDQADSASIRSFKSTVRSSLYSANSSPKLSSQQTAQLSSSPPVGQTQTETQTHTLSPALGITTTTTTPAAAAGSTTTSPTHLQAPRLARQGSADSIATFLTTATAASTSTTSPASLHPANQNTDKLLYRMYAVPEPENVFDEMLFSRRMWSDHLPLTYEFILAGKHAIPVTSPSSEGQV